MIRPPYDGDQDYIVVIEPSASSGLSKATSSRDPLELSMNDNTGPQGTLNQHWIPLGSTMTS